MDVSLVVNNQTLNAHKNVLASNCHYFDRMFDIHFKERFQDKIEINISDVSFEILNTLVQFFYTSEIYITENNVQVIFILYIFVYLVSLFVFITFYHINIIIYCTLATREVNRASTKSYLSLYILVLHFSNPRPMGCLPTTCQVIILTRVGHLVCAYVYRTKCLSGENNASV